MDRRTLLWTGGFAGAAALMGGVAAVLPSSRRDASSGAGFASLTPAITETVFALGAGAQLRARSPYCLNPEAALKLPVVGSALTPDLEALARLNPAHILVDHSARDQLGALGQLAEVELLEWLTLSEVRASVQRLAQLLGRAEAGQRLAKELDETLSEQVPVAGPSVLLVMSAADLGRGDLWYIKRNSLHGAALHAAGARNAVNEDVAGLPKMSVETLLQIDPDYIVVLVPDGSLTPDEVREIGEAFDALTPLSAVAKGRVGVATGHNLLGIGPGITRLSGVVRSTLEGLGADLG